MSINTVVVGLDGSTEATAALLAAAEVAAASDAMLHLVTAFDPPSDSDFGRFLGSQPVEVRDLHDPTVRAQAILADASRTLGEMDVKHQDHIIDADPVEAILDLAERVDADLIVIGRRREGGPRFSRGSVSARIANHATRNYMVVQQ